MLEKGEEANFANCNFILHSSDSNYDQKTFLFLYFIAVSYSYSWITYLLINTKKLRANDLPLTPTGA